MQGTTAVSGNLAHLIWTEKRTHKSVYLEGEDCGTIVVEACFCTQAVVVVRMLEQCKH